MLARLWHSIVPLFIRSNIDDSEARAMIGRREFLLGLGGSCAIGLGLAACKSKGGGAGAGSCSDTGSLAADQKALRKQLGYEGVTPIAAKTCGNCKLYVKPAAGSSCGGCQLFKGPVETGGYCKSWAEA